MKHKKYS